MKSIRQITLRLTEDIAKRLAACTLSRKSNQFVVDLLSRGIDRESREQEEADMRLSSFEAAHAIEDTQWLTLDDDEAAWGGFDEQRFSRELHDQAQKAIQPSRAVAA